MCNTGGIDLIPAAPSAAFNLEWMPAMTPKLNTRLLPLAILSLAALATAAEPQADEPREHDTSVTTGRSLAESANEAAARDAVDSILVDTKLDLDIRFRNRISLASTDGD